jgi:hypothetical protein
MMISLSGSKRRFKHPQLRAVRHFESLQERRDPLISSPLVSMFTQDVPLAVMPYRSSGKDGYDSKIVGAESEVRRALELLNSVERYNSHNAKEAVANAIREIAQALAWYGLAPYEIWTAIEGEEEGVEEDEDDIDEDESKSSIGLSWFTPKRLFRFSYFCIQLVPRADQEKWGRSLVILPKRILWLISMPNELGGYRGYRRILSRLARFNWTAPPFRQEELGRGLGFPKTNFNFSEYRREIDVYQGRVTRKWGWTGRDTSSEKRTEFALFYRIVTFRWAQALLREHILKELNVLLRRLNIEAEIQVVGLPSASEILQVRSAMIEGNVSYTKAYEMTK